MKNNQLEKFEPKKLFEEFIKSFAGYMGKDDIRTMFYSNAYLIYLAKKNNIKLQMPCFGEYAEYIGEIGIGFERLLKKLLDIYSEDTKECLILKDLSDKLNKTNGINKELDDKLFETMSRLTMEEIIEIFIEHSLEFKKYSSRDLDTSSKSIIELVIKLLAIKNNENVLDLCSGNGDFLSNLTKNYKRSNLNGIEINTDIAFISKIRLAVLSENNAEIIVGDALTYDFDEKFDKIFCEYPLGLRVDNFRLNKELFFSWNKPGLTSDWMFLNKVLTLLESKGTAALIITEGPLFKSMDMEYRKDVLKEGLIKYIIKLPSGILPNSNVSANLIILSKNNEKDEIKFIDATQEYIENNQKEKQLNVPAIMDLINNANEDKVKIKKNSEIFSTQDVLLTVNSYVKKKEPNYINPHVLKEFIIDKYRGYEFTAKEQAEIANINGDYEILNIGDINDGKIGDNLLKINGNNNKYDRYLLKNGNIVMTSKGTKIKIAVAEVGNRKIIPNGNLLVLRLDTNKIEPYYLEAFLNSENGRISLEQIQTGAIIKCINPSRIEQINVSMINKEAQELFVEKYKRKMTELFLAQEHVKNLKEQIDNLFKNEIEEKRE